MLKEYESFLCIISFLETACESTVMSKRFDFLKSIEEFRKKIWFFFPTTFGNEDVVNSLASKAVDEKNGAGGLEQRLLSGTSCRQRGFSRPAKSTSFWQPPSLLRKFR